MIKILRMEPDFPDYNDPRGYADLILNGDVRAYLQAVKGTENIYV